MSFIQDKNGLRAASELPPHNLTKNRAKITLKDQLDLS
ncbi:hypothetical protein PULV_a0518 [Pseudoalteromonas ulvae UL12]|nr:hypothetical protein [Pseudoalteromonas ulvae UL12]